MEVERHSKCNVALRAVEPGDVDSLYRLECEGDVRRVSWGECPFSRHLIWEYVNNYSADICRDRQLRLVVEADGVFAGAVDITDYDPVNRRAMAGIGIVSDFRGKGVGRKALMACIGFCRGLNLRQLAAMVPVDNEPSLRLFASCGFRHSGLLRHWLGDTDVALLQLFI